MIFIDWLLNQNKRSDNVGWVSRLIAESDAAQKDIADNSQSDFKPYLESLARKSKIRVCLSQSYQEWMGSDDADIKTGSYKQAASPLIGIFWIVDGEIVPFTTEVDSIPVQAGFKDTNFYHYSECPKMEEWFPDLINKEYEEVPRGRVIGLGQNGYRIFLPPDEVSNSSLISRVFGVFNLPRNNTEIVGDEHYVVDRSRQWSILNNNEDYDPFDEE